MLDCFTSPSINFDNCAYFTLKWTPRLLVAGLAGFYSLGVAYDLGLMAAIDQLAIRILKHQVGYVGLGAAMPTVQWYAAWGVRMTAAIGAGLLYDFIERIVKTILAYFRPPEPNQSLQIAPQTRSFQEAPLERDQIPDFLDPRSPKQEASYTRTPFKQALKQRNSLTSTLFQQQDEQAEVVG